jgi:hypothetical protein
LAEINITTTCHIDSHYYCQLSKRSTIWSQILAKHSR